MRYYKNIKSVKKITIILKKGAKQFEKLDKDSITLNWNKEMNIN